MLYVISPIILSPVYVYPFHLLLSFDQMYPVRHRTPRHTPRQLVASYNNNRLQIALKECQNSKIKSNVHDANGVKLKFKFSWLHISLKCCQLQVDGGNDVLYCEIILLHNDIV